MEENIQKIPLVCISEVPSREDKTFLFGNYLFYWCQHIAYLLLKIPVCPSLDLESFLLLKNIYFVWEFTSEFPGYDLSRAGKQAILLKQFFSFSWNIIMLTGPMGPLPCWTSAS